MFHVLSQTGTLLHEDHVNTLAALENLEELLRKKSPKKVPEGSDPDLRAVLTEIRGVTCREVGRHFGFEEEHLFPVLTQAGQIGMVMLLKGEHEAILPVANALNTLANTLLEAWEVTPEQWQEFHALGSEMVERESFHIQKEEMGLLAAINALIDPDTDSRLAEIFRNLPEA